MRRCNLAAYKLTGDGVASTVCTYHEYRDNVGPSPKGGGGAEPSRRLLSYISATENHNLPTWRPLIVSHINSVEHPDKKLTLRSYDNSTIQVFRIEIRYFKLRAR